MNEQHPSQETPKQPAGVVSCLTTGFEIVAHHPQLALLPALLDFYLWLGPRLSLAPLIAVTRQLWAEVPNPELVPLSQTFNQLLDELATKYNLFALLKPAPFLGVPALMAERLTLARPFGPRPELPVSDPGTALAWICVLVGVGLGLNALYLWQVGRRVVSETETAVPGPVGPVKLWGNLLRLTVLLLAIFFILAIPGSIALLILGAIAATIAALFLMLALSLVFFVIFHLVYTVPGIVQLRQPPLQALRDSIILARVDPLGTTSLVLALLVISQGLNFIWTLPDPATWATVVGIAGHAIVSTALTATVLVFYQERLVQLQTLQRAYTALGEPAQDAAQAAHSHADT
ncbi:MAG: hypothetical protein J7M17_05315 [Anaerolineae bacterium]|nr:hypothetical protein [Anaerolineae bacterium]